MKIYIESNIPSEKMDEFLKRLKQLFKERQNARHSK